ncbi:MAG: glycoside hydrolase family 3 C-terminal domain-containing protein [Clostridiales bacterium]|nr:glycoside hydrolase family 3 C-terminal domain-containing protein [Clostridiales bacterium]
MVVEGFREFVRLAAAEGMVLLKNEHNVLPIQNEKTAVFGRCQIDYYKSGTGSGGAVNTRHTVNILEGFRNNDSILVDEEIAKMYEELTKSTPNADENRWEADFCDYEPEISENVIKAAAQRNDKAIIVIGRVAGEFYDDKYVKGGYLLSDNERKLIENIAKYFKRFAVLLNCGNLIDMKWVEEYNVPCAMYIWAGGEEGGNAAADVVSGIVPPSGRLADTIAREYSMYPSSDGFDGENEIIYNEDIFVGYRYFETFKKDEVLYPFGFGITYTSFETVCERADKNGDEIALTFSVKNTGAFPGREVIEVYVGCSAKKLTRPARELAAFAKTKEIMPGESVSVNIIFNTKNLAAYDDCGASGYKSAWVLENGTYSIYAGKNVRDAAEVFSFDIPKTTVVKQLTECMAPEKEFKRMVNIDGKIAFQTVNTRSISMNERTKTAEEIIKPYTGSFEDAVKEGKIREFAASLSDKELMTISRGEGMLSPKVTAGVASCFGGVSDALQKRGIPLACTSDGPSGIRMDNGEAATSMPCGTLLACSWDTEMVEKLYTFAGKELCLNKIDMLLGPGMNIHRNPLCGRNFEYFSEDPLLSGTMAAANINGLNNGGASGVIKHFACNNREYRRHFVNAAVSERALREIYLRGFEIAVKTSPVLGIMTSYNPVNGYHSASNYELTTSILRKDWGYDGLVMTDWWSKLNYVPDEEADKTKTGAMVRAQNDIYMVVENFQAEEWHDDMSTALCEGLITKTMLQRNAANILNVISKLLCFERRYGFRHRADKKEALFKTISPKREYNTFKCTIPKNTKRKTVYVYLDSVSADKGKHNCYKALAKPGDEMLIKLCGNKQGRAEIAADICTDSPELTQFAMYIKIADKQYPISFGGTSGKIKRISTIVDLSEGENEAVFAFSKTNTDKTALKSLEIRNII